MLSFQKKRRQTYRFDINMIYREGKEVPYMKRFSVTGVTEYRL